MSEPVIRMENIVKTYYLGKPNELEILHGINLTVNKGEFVSIVGESGSGKSTLMNIIGVLDRQTQGDYYLEGQDVNGMSDEVRSAIRNRRIGFVFQNFNLLPRANALKNVMVPLLYGEEHSKNGKEHAMEMLKMVGMEDRADHRPNELSGGQKQRVAIARVLASDPKILLCDEATSALDPQTTKAILELIKEINRDYGITVVVITHEMSVVQEICNRVAVLESGTLVESGTVEELFRSPKTEAARRLVFSGRTQIQKMEGKRLVRVTFRDKSSFEPVIANLVLTYRTPVNILYADTKNIGGAAEGEMILQLPEDERAAKRALAYLEIQNVHAEEVADYASV